MSLSKRSSVNFFNTNKQTKVLQEPFETEEAINTNYYTVLTEVNSFYKQARPNAGMRGIKILPYNVPTHRSNLVQE